MINGTNVLRDDNPQRATINLPETPACSRLVSRAGPKLAVTAAIAGWLASIPSKLGYLLRSAGAWLYTINDAEALWWDWQATELLFGLGRRYRDSCFDNHRAEDDDLP